LAFFTFKSSIKNLLIIGKMHLKIDEKTLFIIELAEHRELRLPKFIKYTLNYV